MTAGCSRAAKFRPAASAAPHCCPAGLLQRMMQNPAGTTVKQWAAVLQDAGSVLAGPTFLPHTMPLLIDAGGMRSGDSGGGRSASGSSRGGDASSICSSAGGSTSSALFLPAVQRCMESLLLPGQAQQAPPQGQHAAAGPADAPITALLLAEFAATCIMEAANIQQRQDSPLAPHVLQLLEQGLLYQTLLLALRMLPAMLGAADAVLEAGLGSHFPASCEFGDSAEQREQANVQHVQQRCFAGRMAVGELCAWLYLRRAWHQWALLEQVQGLATSACALVHLLAVGSRQEWPESRLQDLLAFPAGESPALSAVQHLEPAVFAAMHAIGELNLVGLPCTDTDSPASQAASRWVDLACACACCHLHSALLCGVTCRAACLLANIALPCLLCNCRQMRVALLELSAACSTLLQLMSDDPAVAAAAAAGGPALDRRRHGVLLQVAGMQLHVAFVGQGLKLPTTRVAAMLGLAQAVRLAAVSAP